jgi:Fe-Mn family superoxide dismutase
VTYASPGPVFLAAQQAAGVIAARHSGDFAGAEELLGAIGDETVRARGFMLLAELALALVRSQTGQGMDELVQEVTLLMAEVVSSAGNEPG